MIPAPPTVHQSNAASIPSKHPSPPVNHIGSETDDSVKRHPVITYWGDTLSSSEDDVKENLSANLSDPDSSDEADPEPPDEADSVESSPVPSTPTATSTPPFPASSEVNHPLTSRASENESKDVSGVAVVVDEGVTESDSDSHGAEYIEVASSPRTPTQSSPTTTTTPSPVTKVLTPAVHGSPHTKDSTSRGEDRECAPGSKRTDAKGTYATITEHHPTPTVSNRRSLFGTSTRNAGVARSRPVGRGSPPDDDLQAKINEYNCGRIDGLPPWENKDGSFVDLTSTEKCQMIESEDSCPLLYMFRRVENECKRKAWLANGGGIIPPAFRHHISRTTHPHYWC